jgi:DedD protein
VERHLKERLIGAAVLVAVAIILIPEMLSGPATDSQNSDATPVAADGSAIKTYTIDLRKREQASDLPVAAPPPELVPEVPPAEVTKPEPEPTQPEPEAERVAQPAQAEPQRQPEPVAAKPAPKPEPVKPQSQPAAIAGGEWAVQVAALDTRAAAEKMAGDLKRDGFSAFVMPVEVKGKTLFRVRVGPVATRQAADALLPKVKRQHAAAAVVPQR